ncbi:MAG: hypothetical protein HQL44_13795 [Alphaproteobacteria bacterium]|nr:hypothetical protein [Alphaproteobacteria bacterium]
MTTSPHESPPYLSLVVTSRNDDHGLNIMQRMQFFVDGWFHQVKRFGLPSELVFVEWNPPKDRQRLIDALRWPAERGPGRLRIIEVPPEIHGRFQVADKLPLIQFTAKNAGIRRAKGEYVLCSNIDILFSDEMMEHLAARRLRPDRLYRNDRVDVPTDLPDGGPIGEVLAYAAQHPIRINGAHWTFDLRDGGIFAISSSKLAWAALLGVKLLKELSRQTPAAASGLLLAGRILAGPGNQPFTQRKALAGSVLGAVASQWRKEFEAFATNLRLQWRKKDSQVQAHTNACGDFELMARDKWFALQGYPEYDGFSMHIDSLLLLGAVASGHVTEEVLPFPLRHFHIEHSAGSGFTPEGERQMYERVAKRGIPFILWEEVENIVEGFQLAGTRAAFNDANWGLADAFLPETVLEPTSVLR